MAEIKSLKFARPLPMTGDGRGVWIPDSASVTVAQAANDVLAFSVPPGFELADLQLRVSDMDTNGAPTMAAKVGYRPRSGAATMKVNGVAGVAADDDYFRATAALGQAAAVIDCDFDPIRFDDGADLIVTFTTAAATFAAGTVKTRMAGNMVGPN